MTKTSVLSKMLSNIRIRFNERLQAEISIRNNTFDCFLKAQNILTIFMPQLTRFPWRTVIRLFHFLFTIATPFSTWCYCHTVDFRICLFPIYTCINTCLWIWFVSNILLRSSNSITSYKFTRIFWKKKDCICLNLFHFSKDIRATTLNSFGDY